MKVFLEVCISIALSMGISLSYGKIFGRSEQEVEGVFLFMLALDGVIARAQIKYEVGKS